MTILIFIPAITFLVLLIGERMAGSQRVMPPHQGWDWVIHLSGFLVQGAVIPWCGYLVATRVLPVWLPQAAGIWPAGWWGAFLVNFVLVDFLYYWQHRWFHRIPFFWKLHRCHHTARRLDVWVTSRNSLLLHFLFVYFLVNPVFGYLLDSPEGFFAGAMLTASLDLFRHANIDFSKVPGSCRLGGILSAVLVMPRAHHQHHGAADYEGNYGANLILWDRLFGSYLPPRSATVVYGVEEAPPLPQQWLYPFRTPMKDNSHES